MRPSKLLSLYGPWWWCVAHHSKRRENRDWKHPPAYRGDLWIHAAQKSEPDLAALLDTIIQKAPLRGRTRPTVEDIAAGAGHIVARARLVRIEENTPAVCLADPWAMEGQKGLVLAGVEALDLPIPWKGAQGLADVDPFGVELVRIVASCGHRLDMREVPSAAAKAMVPIIASDSPDVTLATVIERLVKEGNLRQEGDVLFTRAYKAGGNGGGGKKPRGKAKGEQLSLGW